MATQKVENTRHNNISITSAYRTEEEAALYKTQTLDEPILEVQPGIAEVGDRIAIGNTIYTVAGLDSEISGIKILFNNKQAALDYDNDIKNLPVQDILRIPKDSTSSNYDIKSYKPSTTKVANSGTAIDTEYGIAPDGSYFMGAGESGAKLEEGGILKFAQYKASLEFMKSFTEAFNLDGAHSLYEYLASVMSKFYHQLFFIPNLKDNNVILTKPETLFVYPPSCNLILPNIKNSISYTRMYKEEPTRLLLNTDPIELMSVGAGRPVTLNAVLFIEEEDTRAYKHGLRLYKHNPIALGTNKNKLNDIERPMLNITDYEAKNGIKSEIINAGGDIYSYLSARASGKTSHDYNSMNDWDTGQFATIADDEHVGSVMAGLAAYELCRNRFMRRQGSVQMYFNPYIVPGFPLVSIESYSDGMTIFGYATHVSHELTDRSWTTTVSFTAAHTDDENCPRVFPIVEEEYTTGIDTTYKNMLGDNVTPLSNTDIPQIINAYAQEEQTMNNSYEKIWRETPSLDSYLEHIADGATLQYDQNYAWLQNSEQSAFFNVEIQARIREYANEIMNSHIAYHHDAVR